jgi:hypothetical protein
MYQEFYFSLNICHPDSMKMYLAPIQAIMSNLYTTVLQKYDAGKLVSDGLSIWRALCIFRSHKLEHTSELTSAKTLRICAIMAFARVDCIEMDFIMLMKEPRQFQTYRVLADDHISDCWS